MEPFSLQAKIWLFRSWEAELVTSTKLKFKGGLKGRGGFFCFQKYGVGLVQCGMGRFGMCVCSVFSMVVGDVSNVLQLRTSAVLQYSFSLPYGFSRGKSKTNLLVCPAV